MNVLGPVKCIVEASGASCDRIAFGLCDERGAADLGDAVGQAVVDADAQIVHHGVDSVHHETALHKDPVCSPDEP
jgi:hypothetical protein